MTPPILPSLSPGKTATVVQAVTLGSTWSETLELLAALQPSALPAVGRIIIKQGNGAARNDVSR